MLRYPPPCKPAAAVKTKARKPGDCPKHRAWIRMNLCMMHGGECQGRVQAAHVRTGTDGATGKKPHDRWCVPLCEKHHLEQHRVGELTFWGDADRAKRAAEHFAARSPDPTVREPR